MWLFKPPLSKHPFPHLSHRKHIVAHVLFPYDYSNHHCQSTHFHIYHMENILLHMFSLHMTIQIALINAPISTFNTRKPSYCVCSLLIWLFNPHSPRSLFHIHHNKILYWHKWRPPTTTYVRPRPWRLLLQIKAKAILTSCQ